MKKKLVFVMLSVSLSASLLSAGGKGVERAESEVIPIVEAYSNWYLGAGLVWAKLHGCEMTSCSYEDVTYGGMLRGGYDHNEYIGLEARGIYTFLDEGPLGGTPLEHVGLYIKPQYPITERINGYGLLGYGYTKNLGNGARLDYFDEDHGFSAGAGIEFDLSDKEGDFVKGAMYDRAFDGHADQGKGWSLFVDYQRLLIKSGIPDLDAVSFGLRYDF